jgi:integrase
MATIKARKQANGEMRYTAIVRVRSGQTVLHSESKTFGYRSAASTWAKRREVALEDPAELQRAQESADPAEGYKLAALIRWYIETFESLSKWQRSKQTHLKFLERHAIGATDARKMTTQGLIQHIQSRRADGAGPATACNDLTWIGVVLRAAKNVKAMPVRPEIVQEARSACRELRLIAKARRRDRRPTAEEIRKLDEYFAKRDRRSRLPMGGIWHFAIESTRREAEICRLEWADNDEVGRTGLVRDAKHPTDKDGNHRRFKYTPEAWAIVQRQPRVDQRIFPYDPKSVCAAFTRACKVLGIVDLRFHDSRHEGTSRLFERGYHFHVVAQFSLHESWNELKRYTNLRAADVRDIVRPTPQTIAGSDSENRATRRPSVAGGRSARRGRPRSPATATFARQA